MGEIVRSKLTNKEYDIKNIVRIINIYQSTYYMNNNIMPLDIYVSRDFETGKPIMVFIFDKRQTKPLYEKWIATKPDKEDTNE